MDQRATRGRGDLRLRGFSSAKGWDRVPRRGSCPLVLARRSSVRLGFGTGHHRAQAGGGGAPGPSVVHGEHGPGQPGDARHQRPRADDGRCARRRALDLCLRPGLGELSLRAGQRVVARGDGADPAGISRCFRLGRTGPADGATGRGGVPSTEGLGWSRALGSGRTYGARPDSGAFQGTVPDRDGPLPQGRQALHVRAAPVLVPAGLDAAGGAALPGDRPPAGRRPHHAVDVSPPARQRGQTGRRPAHRACRLLGPRPRYRSPHLVRRNLPHLWAAATGTHDRRCRVAGTHPPGGSAHGPGSGGGRYDVEFRVVRPGGEVRIVHSQTNVMRDEAGRPRRMFGTVQDITERRRAEEALREAQAELAHVTRVLTLGEMTASIAHEVNQPLAGVTTNGNAGLRWLARDPPNLEEARECLQRIIRDGNRASEVIARMRTFARKATRQKAPLAINDVIAEVLALADSELRRHRVALHTDLAAGLPPVWGDRVQVQQVLLNLVLNGVEAMRGVTDRPRALLVRSQPEEAEAIRIAVQDAGTGIAPQDLERVFTAFYTTKPAGLGMGLAISRSIVEAHGGRLWATPNDGPGATVQFTLPTGGEPVS